MTSRRRPSYGTIESTREQHYALDWPETVPDTDPASRYYARERPRVLNLPSLLPYDTENQGDRAKFLAHIVAHLYIAVQSRDLQGLLLVTAKDLAQLRDEAGLLDLDLALETNLFEMADDAMEVDGVETERELELDDLDDDDDDLDALHNDEDDGDLDGDSSRPDLTLQHKKSPKSAAVVGVRIWTHELLVWLKMKYDMPVTLRAALARVYYAICMSRGQHLNLKIYVKTFELLTRPELVRKYLSLPWSPLAAELVNHFPQVDALYEPLEKKDLALMLRLAERAAPFFDPAALPDIFRTFALRFTISNASLVLSLLAMMPTPFTGTGGVFPDTDVRHYIPALFAMWEKLSKSQGLDSHLTSRLGTIAMAYLDHIAHNPATPALFGPFGLFSRLHYLYLINTLLNSLSINNDKFASLNTKFFHGFSSCIVYSFGQDSDEALNLLDALLNAIQSYVHPSNSGDWSRPISRLVLSLVYQLHKRYNMERQPAGALATLPDQIKLSDALVTRFVRSLLPVVRTGLQSKRNSAAEDYLSALSLLCHLNLLLALGYILPDIYESLEGVISNHRVVTALRCMEELTRHFAATPIYRMHLIPIFTLALPGIDSNDLSKSIHTFNAFSAMANFVPIYDLTEGNGDPALAMELTMMHLSDLQEKLYTNSSEPFVIDAETEVRALKSSTAAFKFLIKSLTQRVFTLLENIPDPSKGNGIEKDLCDCLPKFLFIIIEAMSDDIFKSFKDQMFQFVLDNTIHPIADVAAEICGAIIKRNPQYFKEFSSILIDRIKEDVIENGAGKSRTGIDIAPLDQGLYWNLMILNECIGNSGEMIVEMEKTLVDLSFFLMDNVLGSTIFSSTYLLNQMLQGATKIRLKETRLISPAYEIREGVDERCWGGFQFDEYRFSEENLSFKWFIPGEREVLFAVTTFKQHVSRALTNILGVMKRIVSSKEKGNVPLDLSDELRGYLLYLAYGVSGVSYLFDPSFDEDIPKLSDHKLESMQNRLKLLAQIRDLKSTKLFDTEETRLENIHENIQQIAENIQNDSIDFGIVDSENILNGDVLVYTNPKGAASEESVDTAAFRRPDLHKLTKSESPVDRSAAASPRVAGVDMSSMNPAITFRERKLYTSKYYFGDDIETRKSNSLYIDLHKTRHLVGKSLHYICKFVQTHLNDNTKMFKHLLYAINIWFADVGRERVLDHSHAKVSFAYVNELQKINRIRKPFTRLAMGARIESYHLLRVALHATSRSITQLDKTLLEDIVKLSCSTYTAIANPAQSTLMDAMKRVNGSYNVIIKSSLRHISKALADNNFKNIESGLSIFDLKRVKSKIQNDYINLQRFVEILHKALDVDNIEVNEIAQKLFKDLGGGAISPPSNVCLIDEDLVNSIRPPDEFIDLEIKAVRLAKEKKRIIYLERLSKIEDVVVLHEMQNTHWKSSSLNLLFLIDLQTTYEMKTKNEVFQLLTRVASIDHPIISRLALKGITKLLSKLYLLSAFDYSICNAYDLNYIMKDLVLIDTSRKDGKSYYEAWKKELKNLQAPNYFIDHKPNSGWLFWDKSMVAVANIPGNELKLKETDKAIVDGFSSFVTKEWFLGIVHLWVADNDSNSAFQGTDVFFTSNIVMLISNKFIQGFSFDDLTDVIKSVYEKDEKSSHIVVCELITGILLGSKFTDPSLNAKRDLFLADFLREIFENDLTSETKHVWNIFFWWVPAHVDCRRFPIILEVMLKFQISKSSDLAMNESTRLNYVKSYIASVTWAFPFTEEILDLCFNNMDDRHQAVREQIGSLIAITCFSLFEESYASSEEFLDACDKYGFLLYKKSKPEVLFGRIPSLFESLETWRLEAKDKLTQEILDSKYIHAATTILWWLRQTLNTSVAVQFQDLVDKYIVPFLLNLTAMKEVCQLGGIEPLSAFKRASQIPYDDENLENIVAMLEHYSGENLNVLQSFILGEFTETIYFKNLFKLSETQRLRILELTNSMMYHKNLEIREAAAVTFSGLIHISPPSNIEKIVNSYKKQYAADLDKVRRKYKKTGLKNISSSDSIILHGATLGLGALVHAFTFLSPPPKWIPEILTILSNKASGISGIVGKAAKETLGKFKKTRQDTWHIDSKVFNETQMQELEGVLWKSYFI